MSDIFDKARDLISENTEKAKTLINENDEKVDRALDKVADLVDKQTKGKHREKIADGAAKAKAAIKNFADDDKK
ncbi:MAG: antitoxin [Acidimicrobiia bacterium]